MERSKSNGDQLYVGSRRRDDGSFPEKKYNFLFDVGCGPIFSMNTTMGVKITCETLTNSPAVPLLPMQ
jgi:hypothetical protein